MVKYSVIIISYNEEDNIASCIGSINKNRDDIEIILSDGGSLDKTIEKAMHYSVKIVSSDFGRGVQFNRGAKYASGEILLFLHADTLLPKNAFKILDNYFSSKKTQIGSFRLAFNTRDKALGLYSIFSAIDSIFTRFGDQCIVVRRNFYDRLGGFKDYPLFEDVDFFRRARRLTKILSFPFNVVTSSRRYKSNGVIKQQICNGWYIIQYLLGVSPFKLADKYNMKRDIVDPKNQLFLKYINKVLPYSDR